METNTNEIAEEKKCQNCASDFMGVYYQKLVVIRMPDKIFEKGPEKFAAIFKGLESLTTRFLVLPESAKVDVIDLSSTQEK